MQFEKPETDEMLDFIAQQLAVRRLSLSIAESCTGGLLGGILTSKAGASEWYRGGLIAYSNEAKKDILGVPIEILEAEGAVSRATAIAMAKGARCLFRTDISVSVTGIAGPSGGTQDKPVGTIWMALTAENTARVERQLFKGSRMEIRNKTVGYLLKMLAEYLGETQK